MKFIRLLNMRCWMDAARVKRGWMRPGEPLAIGHQCVLTLFFDVHAEDFEIVMTFDSPSVRIVHRAPDSRAFDLTGRCGLQVLPRAVRFCSSSPVPQALLVDFYAPATAAEAAL